MLWAFAMLKRPSNPWNNPRGRQSVCDDLVRFIALLSGACEADALQCNRGSQYSGRLFPCAMATTVMDRGRAR